ncbi:MAG: ABC transporter ATP-binding protein [Patescibacteria group bacterium]
MSPNIPKDPFKFGVFASTPHKKWVILSVCAVLLATGLDRFSVVVLRNLTDAIAKQPIHFDTVWFWAIAYPLLGLLTGAIWRTSGFMGMRWFSNFRFTAYQKLYEYITLHSKDYFTNRFAGALANKISNAVDGAETVFENLLWRFMPLSLGLFWYMLFAWFSNPWLGFIIWVWSILFLGINFWFAKKIKPRSYLYAESKSLLKGGIVDSLSNISLVHENASLKGEHEYIKKFVGNMRKRGLAEWQLSEWALAANNILIFLFILVMISTAVSLFQQGNISIGSVVMIVAIVGEVTGQFLFIGMEIKNTTNYYGEAQEGLEEVLHNHAIADTQNAINFVFTKGDIMIDRINFHYENRPVFKNFSLNIPSGQKVGFVGRSGAGKTTFVSLLLRHFDVQEGDIKIDQESIYDVKLESLRRAIAFVPQDTSLFHRTILENIRYSNPRATLTEVKHASKLAQADSFIENLPEGYHTMVGERGVKLSGGQRQRIAIARAFLKDAPILILDEATSSLDSESEHAIQVSLEKLMKKRTVIAIAHRLSTLKKMDRIIVIDGGKIVEDGAPNALMQQDKGLFKGMWEHQVKGFITD